MLKDIKFMYLIQFTLLSDAMRGLPKLVAITPEGKIIAALIESPKSYSELKLYTGLSDRWLSKKLKELSFAGLIEHYTNRYQLKESAEIIAADPVFAQFLQGKASLMAKAKLIAEEIGRNEGVVAIILFGSVAKGEVAEDSDIDLLVVTEWETEETLNDLVYKLMFKYNVSVEAIFLTYDDLIINLQAKTTFSFGLLEGYNVLFDRGGVNTLLGIKRKEIQDNWIYDDEAGAWFQKRVLSTLKQQKSR